MDAGAVAGLRELGLVPRTVVLLRRPPDAPSFTDAALEELQAGHLAFLERMAAAGHLLAGGPFTDQTDETLRGLCVYTGTPEETRQLTADDPMVRARRLEAVAVTWWTASDYAV